MQVYIFTLLYAEDNIFNNSEGYVYYNIIKNNFKINYNYHCINLKLIKKNKINNKIRLNKFLKFWFIPFISSAAFIIFQLKSGNSYNYFDNNYYKIPVATYIPLAKINNNNYNVVKNNNVRGEYGGFYEAGLWQKINRTLSQNVSMDLRANINSHTFIPTKMIIPVMQKRGGTGGQITGGLNTSVSSRNVQSQVGDSLQRQNELTNEQNKENYSEICSSLGVESKIYFVDKNEYEIYNNIDLPILFIRRGRHLIKPLHFKNQLVFKWLFYDTCKNTNLKNTFFIKGIAFNDSHKINYDFNAGLTIKHKKIKAGLTAGVNLLNKNFFIHYSWCLNDSDYTTIKNGKKQENIIKGEVPDSKLKKKIIPLSSISEGIVQPLEVAATLSGEPTISNNPQTSQDTDPQTTTSENIQFESYNSINIENFQSCADNDIKRENENFEGKKENKKTYKNEVKGLGAGLKNKKETYKKRIGNEKTGNEEANKKTNKIIEIAIQTISIFSAISLFAYINPQFRNQANLYLDKIKFYDINLKNIILLVLFIPVISLIFSFIFGLFDTTKKVGKIITGVSQSNESIIKPINNSFQTQLDSVNDIIKRIKEIITKLFTSEEENKINIIVDKLNISLDIINALLGLTLFKFIYSLISNLPVLRVLISKILVLLELLEKKLFPFDRDYKDPPNNGNGGDSTNNPNPNTPLIDGGINGEPSSIVEKTIKIKKPKLKKVKKRNLFLLNFKKILKLR